MQITHIDWKRLSPLLDQALDLEPAQREAWLASLAPEYADLRASLQEILLQESAIESSDFLSRPPEFGDLPASVGVATGDLIGRYRVLRKLGSGGTSDVWLAERADGALQRKFAIKLPHLALIDKGLAARMVRERDILAGLEHPNIARLYDAGVDDKGHPYLALEYVDGVTPDQYCAAHACTVRQRLDLFLQIARAVAFAHGRLIVHRDLKPTNVLVTQAGEVRLLDFGIARILQGDVPGATLLTQVGGRALTPAYAAPEQFSKQPITVVTDVYSLGVILFELLTGRSPYSPARETVGAFEDEVLKVEPPLASSVAPFGESRALRGDLDTILAKALRKLPSERYSSVEAFAADIERHLNGLPIGARPPSFWYVARKFATRNALALGFTVAAVLALTAISGVAIWQWQRAVDQRAIAVERLTEAEITADLMTAVITEGVQNDETVTLQELLTRSERLADRAVQADPRVRLLATDLVASWYLGYSWYDKAEHLIARNIDALPAEMTSRVSELKCKHALALAGESRVEESIALLTTEIGRTRSDLRASAFCLQVRAEIAQAVGDSKGSLQFILEAERRFDAAGLQSLSRRGSLLEAVGHAYALSDQTDRAQDYYRRAMTLFERAGRGEGDYALTTLNNWASLNNHVGNSVRALQLFEQALAIAKRRSPTGHPSAVLTNNYANELRILGRYPEALAASAEGAVEAERASDSSSVAYAFDVSADVERRLGNLDRAQKFLDDAAVKLREGNVPAEDSATLKWHLFQAQVWAAQGKRAEAAQEVTRVVDSYVTRGCCGGALADALAIRSGIAAADHRVAAALADALQALEAAKRAQGREPYSSSTGAAFSELGHARELQGQYREANSAYTSAAGHFAHALGELHTETVQALDNASRVASR